MDPVGSSIIVFVFTALCFVLELSYKAVVSQSQNNIKKLFPEDTSASLKLLEIIENTERISNICKVARDLLHMALAVFCSLSFSGKLSDKLFPESFGKTASYIICAAAILIVCHIGIQIFGKKLPEKIAIKYSDTLCTVLLPVLNVWCAVFSPVEKFLEFSSSLFAGIFGVKPDEGSEEVTEDEIRRLIDAGQEDGNIEQSEKDMIHSIFEFDDREVSEITTHRTDVTALEADSTLDEVLDTALSNGFSRIPVYKESLDNVVGVLYTKDLIRLINGNNGISKDGFKLSDYMREALFVPGTNSLKELFDTFKQTHIQLAIVLDEYGGMLGIVSMEDLIESIMGDISDEYDEEPENVEEDSIVKISDNQYTMSGLISVSEVEEKLGITIENEEECETIGGLAVSIIGMIPDENEKPVIDCGNFIIKVESVAEHHIERLVIEVKACEDGSEEQADKDDNNTSDE